MICERYHCTVTDEFCAKRYKAARDDNLNTHCRTCEHGKKALKALGSYIKKRNVKRKTQKPEHLCSCGTPVTRKGSKCAACRVKESMKAESKSATWNDNGGKPTMTREQKKPKRTCNHEGCDRWIWRKQLCYRHYREKYGNSERKSAESMPDHHVKVALNAQLLYASDLLDQQIHSALSNGVIDTSVIADIRSRLGYVLRESLEGVSDV